MAVLVTGGCGFIGSHLVDLLVEEGQEATIIDNLSSGNPAFLTQHLESGKAQLVREDLLYPRQLQERMKDCDAVFHLAANPDARRGTEVTNLDLQQNTIATYNVLEAMRKADVKNIVFTSSGTVYGLSKVKPTSEDYGPLLPISLYGASKLACEGLISAFSELYGFRAWIIRLANIVGDRATHGVIYDLAGKLSKSQKALRVLGDGCQKKPYVHVTECVQGIVFTYHTANQNINLFNLSTNTTSTVKEIVEVVLELAGVKGMEVNYGQETSGWPGDVSDVQLDDSKLRNLGWSTRLSSIDAIRIASKEILAARLLRKT